MANTPVIYPLMLERTYLPTARFIRLSPETIESGSLYDYLRKNYNFKADRIIAKIL